MIELKPWETVARETFTPDDLKGALDVLGLDATATSVEIYKAARAVIYPPPRWCTRCGVIEPEHGTMEPLLCPTFEPEKGASNV